MASNPQLNLILKLVLPLVQNKYWWNVKSDKDTILAHKMYSVDEMDKKRQGQPK